MKPNDRNRDERTSKHGGNQSAVLPTADSPKTEPVTAPMHGATGKSDERDLAGKGKDAPGGKSQQGAPGGKSTDEKPRNPDHKR